MTFRLDSPIPVGFANAMRDVYGADGERWIQALPALVQDCADAWSLELGEPFALTYNFVIPATRADGSAAVLKVGYPAKELFAEMAALRHFDGHGIAALLTSDEARGAMLIERLQPGEPITALDDERATAVAAAVMRDLWAPVGADHPFPRTVDWGKGFERLRKAFDGGTGPFPDTVVAQAEELFAALEASSAPAALLHGDFHHGNILSAERAPYLAIDPKGVVGEPAYETGALLRNPMPEFVRRPDAAAQTARRIAQLSDALGFDRQRVKGWGFAQAVLSAWWTWEDHGHVGDYAMECARLIAAAPA